MPKIYTASKLRHRELWRQLAKQNPSVHFHARWYAHADAGHEETPENAAKFWVEDEEDVAASDALLLYAEEGDHLRGALFEAGMALTLGVQVVVVCNGFDYGNWVYHPDVWRVRTLEEAVLLIRGLVRSEREAA